MFDLGNLDAESVGVLAARLAEMPDTDEPRAAVERIKVMERLKCAAAAAQARAASDLDRLVHVEGREPSDASLGSEIGLARHESPHRGRRCLDLGRVLVDDLPQTLAALERGDINERRAEIIADATRALDITARGQVDSELGGKLRDIGDGELRQLVQRLVCRIDGAGAAKRRERAQQERYVHARNLGDGTSEVRARVADYHAAAIIAGLAVGAEEEVLVHGEDGRTRPQRMADLFVQRLTGILHSASMPVDINLVMTAETLLGDDDEPADIVGVGTVPAQVARNLVAASPVERTRIRRLFKFADTDRLIAMESSSRSFRGLLAFFLRLRDQRCRMPYCNARIRHIDHVTAASEGGATSEINGQGLCERCNYVKEMPGWRHLALADETSPHAVTVVTPTGDIYSTLPPDSPQPRAAPHYELAEPGHWVLVS